MSTMKLGIAIYAQQGSYGRPRGPHWALVLCPPSSTDTPAPAPESVSKANLPLGQLYNAPDVRIYHIRGRNLVWTLAHEVRDLAGMGDLVGVLHIADFEVQERDSQLKLEDQSAALSNGHQDGGAEDAFKPVIDNSNFTFASLHKYIKSFPPTASKDGSDPSDPAGLFIWTCESYVIRIVARLAEAEKKAGNPGLLLPCKPGEMYDYTKRRIAALKSVERGVNDGGVRVISFAE